MGIIKDGMTYKQIGEAFAKLEKLIEDAPTNAVGSGEIAGAGVGPDGEPGRKTKRKKDSDDIVMALLKRKMPKK